MYVLTYMHGNLQNTNTRDSLLHFDAPISPWTRNTTDRTLPVDGAGPARRKSDPHRT